MHSPWKGTLEGALMEPLSGGGRVTVLPWGVKLDGRGSGLALKNKG